MNERNTSCQAARVSNEGRDTKTWNAHELGDGKRKKVAKGKRRTRKGKKRSDRKAALVVMAPSGRGRRPNTQQRASTE
jgi:hypothetical protein